MNMLFVLADSAMTHVYGANGGPAQTPHADRIACEGATFTHAFTAAAICHPARSVIDTGQYMHANGMLTNRCGRGAYQFGTYPEAPSLAGTLAAAGYRCGYTGQGHIDIRGFHDVKATPTPEWAAMLKSRGYTETAMEEHRYPGCGRLPYGLELVRDTTFAMSAIELIDLYAGIDQPWFIECDFDGPHPPALVPEPFDTLHPWDDIELPPSLRCPLDDVPEIHRMTRRSQGGQNWDDAQWRRFIAHYYGSVSMIDHLFGTVLERLDAHGLTENTAVIFTSDHGCSIGCHGFVGHGHSAMFDELVKVPYFVRMPGMAGGQVIGSLVSHADLLPTVAELAGAGAPAACHGTSWAGLLNGDPDQREDVFGQFHGDGVLFYSVRWVRTQDWKYVISPGGEELYDLRNDPHELRNVRDETALQPLRARLHARMEILDDPFRTTAIWRSVYRP